LHKTDIPVMYHNGGFEDFPSNYLKVININEIFFYLKILKKFDIILSESKEKSKVCGRNNRHAEHH